MDLNENITNEEYSKFYNASIKEVYDEIFKSKGDRWHNLVALWIEKNNLPAQSLDEIDYELFTTEEMWNQRVVICNHYFTW